MEEPESELTESLTDSKGQRQKKTIVRRKLSWGKGEGGEGEEGGKEREGKGEREREEEREGGERASTESWDSLHFDKCSIPSYCGKGRAGIREN